VFENSAKEDNYIREREMKYDEGGGNCVMKSFIIFSVHIILLG
jgi:hypothetical protein